MRVRKPANPAQGAEIMVEGPILLHQENHVLNVGDRFRPVIGGNCQRLTKIQRQRCRGDGRNPGHSQECATVNGAHANPPGCADQRSRTRSYRCDMDTKWPPVKGCTNHRRWANVVLSAGSPASADQG